MEDSNYENVLWFVDVVEMVSYFTWYSGYWVWFLMIIFSSAILPNTSPTEFNTFYKNDGT